MAAPAPTCKLHMAIQWQTLVSEVQLNELVARSFEVPCLILKHSTRCNISAIAKYRLESDWDFATTDMETWYIDVIAQRPLSQKTAELFGVHHESPQVLLIVKGECVYDASHLDISVEELREGLSAPELFPQH